MSFTCNDVLSSISKHPIARTVVDDKKHDRFAMKTFSMKELEEVEDYMRTN